MFMTLKIPHKFGNVYSPRSCPPVCLDPWSSNACFLISGKRRTTPWRTISGKLKTLLMPLQINSPVPHKDLLQSTILGLGPSYASLIQNITLLPRQLTFSDLGTILKEQERLMQYMRTSDSDFGQPAFDAQSFGRGSSTGQYRGRGSRGSCGGGGRGRGGRGRGLHPQPATSINGSTTSHNTGNSGKSRTLGVSDNIKS
ncbi:unnamed protein product [Cuscuta europaea]|uniref:Uncharacterized protein n=1 Tax=Cuscuta europaea TaxID=41803 RepID=A0A9P1EBB3_CUSEU|nr:unnamed protein product [Cuscuta europaea]